MGLFDKFKTIFQKEPEKVTKYEEGLEKTRKEFISQLSNLSNNFHDEPYGDSIHI